MLVDKGPHFVELDFWRCMGEHMATRPCCHLGLLVWCLAKW
jgi:hypothetical protein